MLVAMAARHLHWVCVSQRQASHDPGLPGINVATNLLERNHQCKTWVKWGAITSWQGGATSWSAVHMRLEAINAGLRSMSTVLQKSLAAQFVAAWLAIRCEKAGLFEQSLPKGLQHQSHQRLSWFADP